jgi:hypothetical protein
VRDDRRPLEVGRHPRSGYEDVRPHIATRLRQRRLSSAVSAHTGTGPRAAARSCRRGVRALRRPHSDRQSSTARSRSCAEVETAAPGRRGRPAEPRLYGSSVSVSVPPRSGFFVTTGRARDARLRLLGRERARARFGSRAFRSPSTS